MYQFVENPLLLLERNKSQSAQRQFICSYFAIPRALPSEPQTATVYLFLFHRSLLRLPGLYLTRKQDGQQCTLSYVGYLFGHCLI